MMKSKKQMREMIQNHGIRRQERLRKEFLPEALEIIEKPISPLGHFVIIITTFVILATILWSYFGKIDQVANARGKIVTTKGVQLIQPVKGGSVKEICVKEGDHVKAGETMMYLDDSQEDIHMKGLNEAIEMMEFQNELLEILSKEGDISKYLESENNKEKLEIINYAQSLQLDYLSQRSSLESTVEQNTIQVSMQEETLEKLNEQKQLLSESEQALKEQGKDGMSPALDKINYLIAEKEKEVSDYQELYNEGAVSLIQLEQVQSELEQLKKDYAIQENEDLTNAYNDTVSVSGIKEKILAVEQECNSQLKEIDIAKETLNQSKVSLQSLKSQYMGKLSELINQNNNNIKAQQVEVDLQLLNFQAQKLIAPVNGIVKTLDANTVGGVVSSTQIVATVIPDNTQLIVEASIPSKDIGFIKPGQSVSVKLDTYDFQKYGDLKGKITYFSPDTVFDEKKGWIYNAKIAVDSKEFQKKNKDLKLDIGMECTAEIKIGSRRIIDFFLEPLTEHFHNSLSVQ